jgi:hypothetical protein
MPDFMADTSLIAWNQIGMKKTIMEKDPPRRNAIIGPNIKSINV